MIRDAFTAKPDIAEKIIKMLMAPQELERTKFGIDPVLHDVNTALYLVAPKQYSGRQGFLKVVENGRSDFTEDPSGPVLTLDTIKNADVLFEIILSSLKDVLLK